MSDAKATVERPWTKSESVTIFDVVERKGGRLHKLVDVCLFGIVCVLAGMAIERYAVPLLTHDDPDPRAAIRMLGDLEGTRTATNLHGGTK